MLRDYESQIRTKKYMEEHLSYLLHSGLFSPDSLIIFRKKRSRGSHKRVSPASFHFMVAAIAASTNLPFS